MSDTIFKVEYHPGEEVVLRFKPPDFYKFPGPTKQHLLTAKKEMLLALRGMLDKAIEKTEERAKPKGKAKTTSEVQ